MTVRLRTRPFAVSLTTPLSTARGDVGRREGLLVGVERDGTRGVGEATPLPGWTESLDACRRDLSTLVAGGATESAALLDALDDAPAARHGVETALADAAARASGNPLAATLADGTPASSVPVNATVGDGPPASTAADARDAVAAGFECLKVKVGAREVAADVERLRAVRDAVGDAVELRADANGAWDREAATRAVEAFASLGVAYVEQPLPADDLSGHAALRDRGVAVAVDESLATRGLDAVLDAAAADVVVCKPMVLGGPRRAVAAARRAREAGVEPVVTTTVDAAVARAAAVHVAAALPDVPACGLATGELLSADLVADPAPVAAGQVRVPAGPGVCGDAADGLLWDGSRDGA